MNSIKSCCIEFRLVAIILIGILSVGCKPTTSDVLQPSTCKVSYKYKDSTKQLKRKQLSYIEDVVHDTIIYDSKTPDKYLPRVGDVVTSGVCEKFPHGVGVVVQDIQQMASGNYKCVTKPARLDQIFDDLKIKSYTNIITDESGEISVVDEDGQEVKLKVVGKTQQNAHRASYNKNFLVINPLSFLEINFGANKSGLKLEIPFKRSFSLNQDGTELEIIGEDYSSLGYLINGVKFNYNLDGSIHAGLGLIYECDLKSRTYKLALVANCGFEVYECILDSDIEKAIPLPKKLEHLFNYQTKKFYIDLGPIVLNASVQLKLEPEMDFYGYLKCYASKDLGVEVGITQDGAYKTVHSTGNESKLIQIDSINSKAGLSLPFHPNVIVGLYDDQIINGKIEPTIKLGIETDLRLKDEDLYKKNPSLKVYTKGSLDASFNLFEPSVANISKKASITSFDIWQKGWPLLPRLDMSSLSIVPKKSGSKYVSSFGFSSDGILQKWHDDMYVGAVISEGDSIIQKQPEGRKDLISAKKKYSYTFDNLSLEEGRSYMLFPVIEWKNRVYKTNGVAFAVNGVTFNTKDYYIKSVKYYDAYSDEDYGCDFWDRDHYHYYHDLIFEVNGSEKCAEIGNQCTTDDYHRELSLNLHDGILKGQYVYLTTQKTSSFMVETVPYAYLLNGERLSFEPFQFRLWRDDSVVPEWIK